MLKQSYSSNIKSFPFLFLEMKRTALLLCEGKSRDEILTLSIENNIYQLEKEKRRRELPSKMLARLKVLNQSLIEVIAKGHDSEAKLVTFFAMMKSDRLLYEYMLDVYKGKSDNDEITDLEFMQFADRLSANSETVAKWKTETLIELNTRIKRVLCDAGLAKRSKTRLIVQKPVVDEDLCSLLDEDDWLYAKAILREDARYGIK